MCFYERIEEGTIDYFRLDLAYATEQNKVYLLTFKDGTKLKGIPRIENDFITVRGNNEYFRIPINQLSETRLIETRNDEFFMDKAINLSRTCCPEEDKINPKVAAVLVQNKEILGEAKRGQLKAGEHAEYTLLERILSDRDVLGSTLYTTLEPCTKRNPPKTPCTNLVINRRIERVVIGMLDPNQDIRGEGVWQLREAGIQVSFCQADQMKSIEDISRQFVTKYRK